MECLNELMDTSPVDSYFEEGEIESNDDDGDFENPRFGLFEDDEDVRKLNRLKKFALWTEEDAGKNQNHELFQLYRDLGIDKENERHYRFNAIHMRGTQDLTTDDVLDYFESYSPLNIEWVNDISCNVVWSDDVSAAKALLGLSKRINKSEHLHGSFPKKSSKQIYSFESEIRDEEIDAENIKVPIPPGSWRIGKPDKKGTFPLLRYATWSDKKQKFSGINNQSKMKCDYLPKIKKSQSLSHEAIHHENTPSLNKNNEQNMQSAVKSNPWSDLAFEWGKTDKVEKINYSQVGIHRDKYSFTNHSNVQDLRLSLKNKRHLQKRFHGRSEEADEQQFPNDWEIKSKIPRMKMYADEEEKKLENSSFKYGATAKPVEDLRSKINRKKKRKRFNLRVERQIESYEANSDSSNDQFENDPSSTWALENYEDLRESLGQYNRFNSGRLNTQRFASEETESDSVDQSDEFYVRNMRQRSPLQIEIDNDEYYEKNSNKR